MCVYDYYVTRTVASSEPISPSKMEVRSAGPRLCFKLTGVANGTDAFVVPALGANAFPEAILKTLIIGIAE